MGRSGIQQGLRHPFWELQACSAEEGAGRCVPTDVGGSSAGQGQFSLRGIQPSGASSPGVQFSLGTLL